MSWNGMPAHSGASGRPYNASPLARLRNSVRWRFAERTSNSARRRAARPHLLSGTVPEPRHKSSAASHSSHYVEEW